MRVIFHRRIQKDLRSSLAFYEEEGGAKLGDRFFAEAEETASAASTNPTRFHFIAEGLRRASFPSFPYHFLFEENERMVHFLVPRHDKRHPGFGLDCRRAGN